MAHIDRNAGKLLSDIERQQQMRQFTCLSATAAIIAFHEIAPRVVSKVAKSLRTNLQSLRRPS